MKLKYTFLSLILVALFSNNVLGQGAYFNGVNLNAEGLALKDELATHIITTHDDFLSYAEVYEILKISDLTPGSTSLVQLMYGSDDSDGVFLTDLTRDKEQTGNEVGSWNREHVYPKSLGTPSFGNSGPGADAHSIRSCDLQMNSTRNNRKFVDGSGIASPIGSDFYPGDQWKGDCARMMMYMYLRYGNQCLPINVGVGTVNTVDANMIDLFLDWNAEDPVSINETVRNDVLEGGQGNRNPFIDNPALATIIWGGPEAEDPWGLLSGVDVILNLKTYLESAYILSDGLMRDQLRTDDLLPIQEPYSAMGYTLDTENASNGVFDIVGNDAIVDWMLLEIRDGVNPTTVLDAKPILLQRDGDMVAADGGLIVINSNLASDVFIALRHRNHFGVRTADSYSLSSNITVDFSDPNLNVFGSGARKIQNGFAFLYSGDANYDGTVNSIDLNIYWRIQNGQIATYPDLLSDFNLDGAVNVVDKNLFWRGNNGLQGSLD